ncbi:MAG: DUF1338 family protein [Planctomycetota bacterium]
MSNAYADRIALQHRLFAELSAMFGAEVPLYDKSLAVNLACNRAVCDLLAKKFPGLALSDADIEATSGERHGAIRIGRPDEYRWIGRFFACFAMEPHGFYDMTALGGKSQPVIATAFRSVINPEHRVFTSLLVSDYFDEATKDRIEAALAGRDVFGETARALIEKCESQGGLDEADAAALIEQATTRVFKWQGKARDHALYTDLCEGGFKIAADIACFDSHHLNHLTPNTFCMDVYTSAMKFLMGELDAEAFRGRTKAALSRLAERAGQDYLILHFKHMDRDSLAALESVSLDESAVAGGLDALVSRLGDTEFELSGYPHNGFKDFTEGPDVATPVLLRQDAYKALTEDVVFTNNDGGATDTVHTARFGEIEQRFYATTPEGRARYDACLQQFEAKRAEDPGLAKRDQPAYLAMQAGAFAEFPKEIEALLDAGLIYGRYRATPEGAAGKAASGETTDLRELRQAGFVAVDGLRYEDFLPFSAAGIFASNLNQYGTASTAKERRTYAQPDLERVLDKPIVDVNVAYRGIEARSILETFEQLGVLGKLDAQRREQLERDAEGCPVPLASVVA